MKITIAVLVTLVAAVLGTVVLTRAQLYEAPHQDVRITRISYANNWAKTREPLPEPLAIPIAQGDVLGFSCVQEPSLAAEQFGIDNAATDCYVLTRVK